MDRVKDYVENLDIKSAVVGGFDKESVYVSLKELVAIFEEEIEKLENECQELQKKIQNYDQVSMVQQNTHTEIFNEMNRLKKYVDAYQEVKKQLEQVNKEKFHLNVINKKIKEEYEQQIKELHQQISSQSNDNKDLLSLDCIKNQLNQTIDQLSQSFIQQNEDILKENQQLKEENQSLKILVEKYQKHQEEDQQHFVDEINQLYKSLETLKNRYIKEEE